MLSFLKKNSGLRNSTLAVFFVFSIVGLMNVTIAAYTPPTCPPPGCNTDAPINVGTTPQFKYGNLTITSPTATGTIISDLLWTNYGAVINADGGGASGVGLLVPRDKVGIGFSGIGTDLPQAKLDVNGTTISRGSLVVGTSTPSWATLDVNGTINSRGDLTIGSSTVGNSRKLNVYGDVVVSEVPVGSTFGYIYKRYLSATSDKLFTGSAPDIDWWHQGFPDLFPTGTNWGQVRLDFSNTDNGCDDTSVTSSECQAVSYDTSDTKPAFTRLYDLWALYNESNNKWSVSLTTYVKVWTKREGGSLTVAKLNASEASFFAADASRVTTYNLYTNHASIGDLIVGDVEAKRLCVQNGPCIGTSTILGTWEKSTSTGPFAGSIFYDGGRVGIGTGPRPETQLHVKGSASTVSGLIENTQNGGDSILSIARKNSIGGDDQWSISATGPNSGMGLFIKNDYISTTSLALLRNGNVGIGTQAPLGILDVVGDGDVRLKPDSLSGQVVVGGRDILLKPNALSGRVLIGENGLVNTIINGNLSLQGRAGGSLQYNNGGEIVISTTSLARDANISISLWPASYTGSNRLSVCDTDLIHEDQACIDGNPFPASSGDPNNKYDLYIKESRPSNFNCGTPPSGSTDNRCGWFIAARVYTKGATSGGDLDARNGVFRGDLIVNGNMGVGTVLPTEKLDVNGGVNATKFCISGDCKLSWATASDLWATSTNGIFFDAGQGNVGIGDVPTTKPLTIYGNPTAWIQLRDSNSVDKWHITGFGGGFNLAESGVADGRIFVQALTGNVGIGLTNPTTKLDVQGTIKANGKVQANEYCDLAGINCTPLPFPSNSTQNGYVRIGNVLMQWGYIDGPLTQNSYNVDFPIAFSNPPFNLNCTARNGDTFNHNDDTWCQVIRATDRKGFFGINWDGSGGNAEANGLYWLAIGNP